MDATEVVDLIGLTIGSIALVGTAVLLVRAALFAWKSVLRRMID